MTFTIPSFSKCNFSYIDFYDNYSIKQCRTSEPIFYKNFYIPECSVLCFYKSGELEYFVIHKDTEFNGIKLTDGTVVYVNEKDTRNYDISNLDNM